MGLDVQLEWAGVLVSIRWCLGERMSWRRVGIPCTRSLSAMRVSMLTTSYLPGRFRTLDVSSLIYCISFLNLKLEQAVTEYDADDEIDLKTRELEEELQRKRDRREADAKIREQALELQRLKNQERRIEEEARTMEEVKQKGEELGRSYGGRRRKRRRERKKR